MESMQKRFFEYVTKRRSKEQVLHTMMDQLYIKKGAAYKRISGDTSLSIDEMSTIANAFGLSVDTALGSDRFMSFEHPFMDQNTSIGFLDRYAFYLKPLLVMEGESSLTYMANEIPVFYYFSHRYIFSFLLEVWNHLHWDEPKHAVELVSADSILYYHPSIRRPALHS